MTDEQRKIVELINAQLRDLPEAERSEAITIIFKGICRTCGALTPDKGICWSCFDSRGDSNDSANR